MSSTSDQQAKQRFLDLQVGNVDLVDEPANLVDFLAVKSMEGSMSTTAAKAASPGNPEGSKAPTPSFTPGTKPGMQAPLNDDGTNVAPSLESMVSNLNKAIAAGKLKADGEEMKKSIANLTKAIGDVLESDVGNNTDDGDKGKGKTAKAKKEEADDGEQGSGNVSKAGGKQFSKERMEAFTKALKDLMGLVKSVDEEAYKSLTSIDSGEGTDGVKPLIPHTVPTPETKKSLEEVTATIKSLNDTVASMAKKLEAVDGGTTKTDADNSTATQTTTKSFWSGVL